MWCADVVTVFTNNSVDVGDRYGGVRLTASVAVCVIRFISKQSNPTAGEGEEAVRVLDASCLLRVGFVFLGGHPTVVSAATDTCVQFPEMLPVRIPA